MLKQKNQQCITNHVTSIGPFDPLADTHTKKLELLIQRYVSKATCNKNGPGDFSAHYYKDFLDSETGCSKWLLRSFYGVLGGLWVAAQW